MLFACLLHHAQEGFSGELEFSHGSGFAGGELLYWKSRGEIDTEHAATTAPIYIAALEARKASIHTWVTHSQASLTVSFQCGKVTKFLVRSSSHAVSEHAMR